MKTIAFAAVSVLLVQAAQAQLVVGDNYNVATAGTGFALGQGVNAGIDSQVTRLTGSAAPNLRYFQTATGKAADNYSISDGRVTIPRSSGSGRYTLSADGTTAYNFGSDLSSGIASAAHPVVYDITMSMANTVSGNTRFSFALATVEDNANFWDFGIQLYRTNAADNFYHIGKRIDAVSSTTATDSTGTTGDLNKPLFVTASGTSGSEMDFLIRVTDAGAETTTFNSRVQLSIDGGLTWIYDTETDADLPNGFRFDTANRYFIWDQAGAASGTGAFTYDDFSVTLIAVPEPSALALAGLAGALALIRRKR